MLTRDRVAEQTGLAQGRDIVPRIRFRAIDLGSVWGDRGIGEAARDRLQCQRGGREFEQHQRLGSINSISRPWFLPR